MGQVLRSVYLGGRTHRRVAFPADQIQMGVRYKAEGLCKTMVGRKIPERPLITQRRLTVLKSV